jgi:hypothetical protein
VICVNCGVDLRTGASVKPHRSSILALFGLAAMLAGGLISAMGLAAVYSYAVVYIPFVYVNAVATVLFACGIGGALRLLSLVLGIESVGLVGLTGLICGSVGLYFAWAFDLVARLPRMGLEVAFTLDPSTLWGYVHLCYEEGTWTMFGVTQKGTWLGVVYLIEAAIIVGGAALASIGTMVNDED